MKPITTSSPSWGSLLRSTVVLLLTFSGVFLPGNAQVRVTFPATDSLTVTADLYRGQSGDPYMLLFHEEGSSRGEYRRIAPRLVKMGYNCLAVDLRTGRESHYISNETARRAALLPIPPKPLDCLKDIDGAIRYATRQSHQPVVLLGSSFSASLCLLQAVRDSMVRAVVAFSPGEFFRPFVSVRDSLKPLTIPVLIAGSKQEYPYLVELASEIPPEDLTLFVPARYDGEHGVASLSPSNQASGDYWLSLLMFFRSIQNPR